MKISFKVIYINLTDDFSFIFDENEKFVRLSSQKFFWSNMYETETEIETGNNGEKKYFQ